MPTVYWTQRTHGSFVCVFRFRFVCSFFFDHFTFHRFTAPCYVRMGNYSISMLSMVFDYNRKVRLFFFFFDFLQAFSFLSKSKALNVTIFWILGLLLTFIFFVLAKTCQNGNLFTEMQHFVLFGVAWKTNGSNNAFASLQIFACILDGVTMSLNEWTDYSSVCVCVVRSMFVTENPLIILFGLIYAFSF